MTRAKLHPVVAAYVFLLRAMFAVAGVYLVLTMVAIVYISLFRWLRWPYSGLSFVFVEYGFIYIMMLGSPWLVRTRGHVFIELITGSVPARVRKVLSRVIAVLCVLACAFLFVFSVDVVWNDICGRVENGQCVREIDVRSARDIPRWIVTCSLPVGFAFMTIEFLRYVFGRELMHPDKIGTFG
jgi:C4-dicarboxylate transporter DctQ subunit